jgi:two-component system sensor histidine kinase/response regulator
MEPIWSLKMKRIPSLMIVAQALETKVMNYWMLACFAVFILACGATQALDVWTLWTPASWLWGTMTAIMAMGSIVTAVLLSIGIVRDVTERKRTEEALRESEERFSGAFEHAPIGMALVSPDGRWLKVNRALCDLLGYSEAELLTRTFQDISHPENLGSDLEYVRRTLSGEIRSYQIVKRYVHARGHLVTVLLNVSLVRDGQGQPRYFIAQIQDITERDRAEAELRWKSAFLEAQVNSSIDGILVVDEQGKKILQNQKIADIFKIPRHIADDKDDGKQIRWVTDMTKNPEQFVEKVIHLYSHPNETSRDEIGMKDGRTLDRYSSPVVGQDGKYYGRIWTFRDITERQLTENALRESNEKFHQLADNITDAFWIRSPDMREVEYISPAFAGIWGRSVESLYANPRAWTDFIFPEDRDRVAGAFALLTGKAPSLDIEYRIVRPDGEVRWVRVRGFQVRDAADQLIRHTGIVTDITERRSDEEKLRESKRFAESIAENSTSFIYLYDVETRRPVYSNRNVGEFLGYSQAQLLEFGEDILPTIVHPEDLPRIAQHHAHFGETPDSRVFDLEFRVKHAGGEWRWIWSRETVFKRRPNGAAWEIMGTAQDITERRRVESELLAAKDAAEAANRAKSEFLANMSHEIRTPMNGIIGMTELVLDTDLDREQRDFLGMAKSSALSLLGLINDILDFSKIEAGKLDMEAIGFGLRDCIGAMLKPLGMRADQKGIELTADIPADVPDHVVGDPMRLRQILINLTDNAIKFTKSGDVMLRVSVESKTDEAHCLHFSIADTGIGIPAAKQALIFEAFAQADGSTTRTYGGTGLGLAIASQLVRQMGGRMWVESAVGEGTTFHFTARLPVRHTPPPNVRHADPRQLKGMRVLVVDDNAGNRRILHEMLANWRMEPSVASSGAEALVEVLRAAGAGTPFPLVILDGMMPEMDGFMVAERIREHTELSGATVMMLTSAMPGGAAARCGELGIASYLTKPVTQSELLQAILIAMGGAAETVTVAQIAPIEQAAARLRILLAEDNVINGAFAAALLEKRGHSLVHAANGREAVKAAAREAFDLIFMDVQMPGMDGFEATRRIRESERASGRHTPIAAMTAHAMAGDRERCLAAGMDDYLSKPLQKAELLALIERISAGRRSAGAAISSVAASGHRQPDALPTLAPESSPGVLPIFSREKLLNELDGDEVLVRRMIALFHENTPRLLDEIRGAIASGSASDLARSTHALLSPLGVFGADAARHLTQQLQTQARDEDCEQAGQTFAALERETAEIHTALDAFTRAPILGQGRSEPGTPGMPLSQTPHLPPQAPVQCQLPPRS